MSPRRGYTLMELLLVLAILVIAAAVTAPSFGRTLRRMAVTSAANDVRTALTKAHVLAMKTGRTRVFQYELGGSKYKIEAYVAGDDELESAQGDPSGAFAGSSTSPQPAAEKKLPEGIK